MYVLDQIYLLTRYIDLMKPDFGLAYFGNKYLKFEENCSAECASLWQIPSHICLHL